MYFPVLEWPRNVDGLSIAVLTAFDPLALFHSGAEANCAARFGLPVSGVLTMDEIIGESLGNASLSSTLVLAFAVLSLVWRQWDCTASSCT